MEHIVRNKEIGRHFESKVNQYFSVYCYTYKSGVSTRGLDLIAISKSNIIYLIETKVRSGKIYISELQNVFDNFKIEMERIIKYTNLLPLPLVIIKNVENKKYGYYYLILFNMNKDEIFLFGAFKKLQNLVDFVIVNEEILARLIYDDLNFEKVSEKLLIGTMSFKISETKSIDFEL